MPLQPRHGPPFFSPILLLFLLLSLLSSCSPSSFVEVGRVKDQRHQEQPSLNYTSISDLRLIRARPTMADIPSRKVFKVFNQDFIVDDRYTVTKELGQGAYGIVW